MNRHFENQISVFSFRSENSIQSTSAQNGIKFDFFQNWEFKEESYLHKYSCSF